jgi:hypothetical protein
MRYKVVQAGMIVGIVGFLGVNPVPAQEKPMTDPSAPILAQQANTEIMNQTEIRTLRAEMAQLQQRIEQLEQRPLAEARPPGSSSAASTLVSASGDNALPDFLKHFKQST